MDRYAISTKLERALEKARIRFLIDAYASETNLWKSFKTIAYESDRKRWELLHSQISHESRTELFNVEYRANEDLRLSARPDTEPEDETAIVFGIPNEGAPISLLLLKARQQRYRLIIFVCEESVTIPGSTGEEIAAGRKIIYVSSDGEMPYLPPPEPPEVKRPSYKKDLTMIPLAGKGAQVILQTFLPANFPQQELQRVLAVNPKAISNEKRSLLLSSIEFLTRYIHNARSTAYLRETQRVTCLLESHEGIWSFLSEMFPEVSFFVGIQKRETKDPVICILNQIPSPDLFETVKPERTLVHFRMPANGETYDGVHFLPPYSSSEVFETRLELGPKPKIIQYDVQKFQKQLFYFHNSYRLQGFSHYSRGYGWSYDTIREYFILRSYFSLRGRRFEDLKDFIFEFDNIPNERAIGPILSRYGVKQ